MQFPPDLWRVSRWLPLSFPPAEVDLASATGIP
ncbi:hypothetical protein CYA_0865 [Synechococcus sp. JA-3-3Ab]|nr:hypothetical protein CYA_0865 [Synechococcus sp. JA-3-3Ab]